MKKTVKAWAAFKQNWETLDIWGDTIAPTKKAATERALHITGEQKVHRLSVHGLEIRPLSLTYDDGRGRKK